MTPVILEDIYTIYIYIHRDQTGKDELRNTSLTSKWIMWSLVTVVTTLWYVVSMSFES